MACCRVPSQGSPLNPILCVGAPARPVVGRLTMSAPLTSLYILGFSVAGTTATVWSSTLFGRSAHAADLEEAVPGGAESVGVAEVDVPYERSRVSVR